MQIDAPRFFHDGEPNPEPSPRPPFIESEIMPTPITSRPRDESTTSTTPTNLNRVGDSIYYTTRIRQRNPNNGESNNGELVAPPRPSPANIGINILEHMKRCRAFYFTGSNRRLVRSLQQGASQISSQDVKLVFSASERFYFLKPGGPERVLPNTVNMAEQFPNGVNGDEYMMTDQPLSLSSRETLGHAFRLCTPLVYFYQSPGSSRRLNRWGLDMNIFCPEDTFGQFMTIGDSWIHVWNLYALAGAVLPSRRSAPPPAEVVQIGTNWESTRFELPGSRATPT